MIQCEGIEKPDDLRYNRRFYEFKDAQMRMIVTLQFAFGTERVEEHSRI